MSHRRIAVYASTFDPPSRFHRAEVDALLENGFDEVVVYPTGPRPLKGEHEHAAPIHRAAIASLAFRGLDRVTIDYTDLSMKSFSSRVTSRPNILRMAKFGISFISA